VPLCRPGATAEGAQAMLESMPPRIRREYTRCFAYLTDEEAARRDGVQLADGPALGFALSDRAVAELAFMATEANHRDPEANYYTPGPWWSWMIGHARQETFTAEHTETPAAGSSVVLGWPRLTLEEVDAL